MTTNNMTSDKRAFPVASGSAVDLAEELERIRREKNPTKDAIALCGMVMGQMLQLGWRKDQLDALEILFWACRDRHGNVIQSNAEISNERHEH